MENTRLKELFTLILNRLMDEKRTYMLGICDVITEIGYNNILNGDNNEDTILKLYLKENKPSPDNEYKEFTKNKYWLDGLYWWDVIYEAPETRQIRIEYLTKLINNISI